MKPVNLVFPLVEIRDLAVSLGGRDVLRGVDLTIPPGRVTTLVGPNGAGKTTLLRATLGLVAPSRGAIVRRPGLRIGYVPQRLSIDRGLPLDVRGFLDLWRTRNGPTVAAALDAVGATGRARTPVQSLSGGEFQRVLLARALMSDPDLLVLDEPDQALDERGRRDLLARIDAFTASGGRGVLMVTHDVETATARADRVFHIDGWARPIGEDLEHRPLGDGTHG